MSCGCEPTSGMARTCTSITPADARKLFVQYLQWMNDNRARAHWYNALKANCSSSVTSYLASNRIGGLSQWDWRNVLIGFGDKMLYDHGDLAGDSLPFAELKRQAFINPVAQAADDKPDFSQRIRTGRAGF